MTHARQMFTTVLLIAATVTLPGAAPAQAATPSSSLNHDLATHLHPCGGIDLQMGLYVVGLSCTQAMVDVQGVERASTPNLWCPRHWQLIRSDRIEGIDAATSSRPPLAVCLHPTRRGLQAYTMDVGSLVG